MANKSEPVMKDTEAVSLPGGPISVEHANPDCGEQVKQVKHKTKRPVFGVRQCERHSVTVGQQGKHSAQFRVTFLDQRSVCDGRIGS